MDREPWREALERATLWDLPIGVYVVDHDGTIVEHNGRATEIFGRDLRGRRMSELYPVAKRDRLFQLLEQTEGQGKVLQKQVLELEIDGKNLVVLDFAKTLKEGQPGQHPALLCCLVEYTEEQRYRRLFERLPAGVYQLDENDHLVHANPQLAKMYGFASVEEMIGRSADTFFADPEQAQRLRVEVQEKGSLADFRAELVRQNGEPFWASIYASMIPRDGRYGGREGVVLDVTREEQYAELIEEMPIGLYRVRRRGDDEIIEHCNRPFAQMSGSDNPEALFGQPIGAFHRNPDLYARLRKELEEKGEATATLPIASGRWVDVRTRDLKRPDGTRTGARVGGALDVTDHHAEIGELREDIGKTLHAYSAALISVGLAIQPALRSLGNDPFAGRSVIPGWTEPLLGDLEPVREELVRQLKRLLVESQDSVRGEHLSAEFCRQLEKLLSKLYRERLERLHPEVRFPTIRRVTLDIADLLSQAEGRGLRGALRAAELNARELARLGSLLALHASQATIAEMSYQVRALREFVTRAHTSVESHTDLPVDTWIRQVVGEHSEFAQSRGVDILGSPVDATSRLRGDRRDLVRCLGNLLHNAIKYSWFKMDPKVRLDVVRKAESVEITVQNDGIPIHPDERDKVFKIGFRGRFAPDRRRTGTGIGLADSYRVAKDHHGDLKVQSDPAPGSRPNDYSQPFITKFTLTLPLASGPWSPET